MSIVRSGRAEVTAAYVDKLYEEDGLRGGRQGRLWEGKHLPYLDIDVEGSYIKAKELEVEEPSFVELMGFRIESEEEE